MTVIDSSVAVTINGIACYDEGTRETFARGLESKAVRVVRCAWGDRLALAGYFMGGSTQIGSLPPALAAGRAYPDFSAWLVKSVDIEGDGVMSVGPNGMVAYERAVLAVTYAPPQFDPANPLLLGSEELEFSSTAVPLGGDDATFKWTSGAKSGQDIPGAMVPAIQITTVSFVKERHFLPELPVTLVMSLVDRVNSTTFFGAAPETVVFRGARSHRNVTAAGTQNWSIAARFEFNPNGWNKLHDGQGWQSFTYKNNQKPFPTADLNQLFA